MIISTILILITFISVILLIITNKLNRAIASLAGALICYFVLVFLEQNNFSMIVDLVFGNQQDGFANLHSITLIVSMMFIVAISNEAGVFQFIAMNLIKSSKGEPIFLLIILSIITLFVSAVLNNILTVIILIPLIITMSRIININPAPYILTQAILVNIGGTLFSISSIPNILITVYANISFIEFFLQIGTLSLIIFCFTLTFFVLLYKGQLKSTEFQETMEILKDFNPWNLVQNRKLLYESVVSLLILFILFITIPPTILTPDIIALTIAIVLIIASRLNPKDLFTKIDLELILYLIGIFIIAGALEYTGLLNLFGLTISQLGGGDSYILILLILWVSAFLSSSIDNIPITKVLIPVIGNIYEINPSFLNKTYYYSLALGANWGDNLTPLGDNILVISLAEQNKRPISFSQFFKLGFITTIYQLIILSIYFTLIYRFLLGITVIILIIIIIGVFYLLFRINKEIYDKYFGNILKKIRNRIIG